MGNRYTYSLLIAVLSLGACSDGSTDGGSGALDAEFGFRTCGTTSNKIGQTVNLVGQPDYPGTSGTAEIIDDCTVRFSNLVSPSTGIRLYAYGGRSTNDFDGDGSGFFFRAEIFDPNQQVIATQGPTDLANDRVRGAGPQLDPFTDGSTDFLVQLKSDRSIDDLNAMSIWCEPASQNFAEGTFQ